LTLDELKSGEKQAEDLTGAESWSSPTSGARESLASGHVPSQQALGIGKISLATWGAD
jgi:hypothetical protein